MTDTYCKDLLEQAHHLATYDASRPKQASLRRSISASYYSVFHSLTLEWSKNFRGAVKCSSRRMLVHGKAKSTALKISSSAKLTLISSNTVCPSNIKRLALNFVELQEYRHKADYDFTVTFRKQDALLMHSRARDSIAAIEYCRTNCNDELQAFVMALHGVRDS